MVVVASVAPFACKRDKAVRSDPANVPLPTSVSHGASTIASISASPSPSVSASIAPIAVPPCTPSPRITWKTGPDEALACSDMVTSRAPLTIEVAKGTPVRLHLRALDAAKPFRGSYAVVGAPTGARLDAKTGDFNWIAAPTPSPVELGFAAIAPADGGLGECATGGVTVRVVENDTTRLNLLRWNFYSDLRDAELGSIPKEADIAHSWIDGESAETNAERRARDVKAAAEERRQYLESLACGHLPGTLLDERDADGDGQLDAVVELKHARSFVLLKTKTGYSVYGLVNGRPEHDTLDHHTLFVDENAAENTQWTNIEWIHAGSTHSLPLDGEVGNFHVEWSYGAGGIDGVTAVHGTTKTQYVWRDGDFQKK